MNRKKQIIEDIVSLPRKFNYLKNRSMRSLLAETGYFDQYGSITEGAILKNLITDKSYVDDWLMWSDDKRTSSGWFFRRIKEQYIVCYFPSTAHIASREFTNPVEACAIFIKHEIEDIRNFG